MEQSDGQIIVWLVIGVGLLAAEIAMPGFILLPFGIGALSAAIASWIGGNLVVQFFVFVVVSAIGFFALRPFARRLNQEGDQSDIGTGRLVGQEGVVTMDIELDRGMVRVLGEDWRAEAAHGSVIPRDTLIRVVEVNGTRLIVTPAAFPEGVMK